LTAQAKPARYGFFFVSHHSSGRFIAFTSRRTVTPFNAFSSGAKLAGASARGSQSGPSD
jgi:hypothetical protein